MLRIGERGERPGVCWFRPSVALSLDANVAHRCTWRADSWHQRGEELMHGGPFRRVDPEN
jgi:hypothetical protein